MINIKEYINGEITTEAVQRAIDCAAAEKKVLYFPAGTYTVASLELKTNSSLYLHRDAVICALTDEKDWTDYRLKPLIYCENAENVSIRGEGVLSCNGWAFVDDNGERKKTTLRPEHVVMMRSCTNVIVENVTLTETVGWTLHLDNCDDVFIDGVIIRNPPYYRRKNSDGIDINGCRNVTVMNCDIETGDDAICLKNIDRTQPNSPRRDMYNINVFNCRTATTCNATKIGTETVGNIYNVKFDNITVCKHSEITAEGAGEPPVNIINTLAAVSVQSNDGAKVHDLVFKNYFVEYVDTPVFILMQKRERFLSPVPEGGISNVTIDGMYVKKSYRNSQILSCKELKIDNVSLSAMHIQNYEEPSGEYESKLPTGKEYPDVYNFGKFPAYGLYARNADNIHIDDDVIFIDKSNTGRTAVDID